MPVDGLLLIRLGDSRLPLVHDNVQTVFGWPNLFCAATLRACPLPTAIPAKNNVGTKSDME